MVKVMSIILLFMLVTTVVVSQATDNMIIEDVFILSDIDKGQIEVRVWVQKESEPHFQNATADVVVEYPDSTRKNTEKIELQKSY